MKKKLLEILKIISNTYKKSIRSKCKYKMKLNEYEVNLKHGIKMTKVINKNIEKNKIF